MSILPPRDMLEATRLTRAGRLAEATALLQGRLPRPAAARPDGPDVGALLRDLLGGAPEPAPAARGPVIDGEAERVEGRPDRPHARPRPARRPATVHVSVPDGARFDLLSHTGPAGTRLYRLYVPASHRPGAPLLIMLHGCTQTPEDFAAGTRMNALAEAHGLLVAYPGQTAAANAQRCWNWFDPKDQGRDRGEPALVAGIARQVLRDHGADPRRVFVAGLSAGGAAAAVLGAAYPDLFAAVGVHSGLPCGAARDVPSAFAAMRGSGAPPARAGGRVTPTIVFHADADPTVHPVNGDHVIAQAGSGSLRLSETRGQVPGGHTWTRRQHRDAEGRAVLEQWVIHGGGHAWSGGSPEGSYTDPRGPDASREMLRFFLDLSASG